MKFFLYSLIAFISSNFVLAENSDDVEQETSVYSAMSMGTAWALTHRHIVTNFHVINGMKNLRILTSDKKEVPVKVVLVDKQNDLAVLSFQDKSLQIKPLPLALTRPRLGTQVFTIGYPHPNLMGTSPKLTSGLINATTGLADDPRTYQMSVPVQSGNSGGPLINMRGEVVGVITSKLSAQKMFEWTGDIPQNVNYAIKINHLSALISKLETDEQVKAGGTIKDQTLETLADNVVGSVIIIAGDGNRRTIGIRNKFLKRKIPSDEVEVKNNKPIFLYSYAEPGGYDMNENIRGSATVAKYSNNSVELLKRQLKYHLDGSVNFVAKSGDGIYKLYDRLKDKSYSTSFCTNKNASNIVVSISERNQGFQFRYVQYLVIDCDTKKDHLKTYELVRDERNDSFGYEVALHTTFKDFLVTLPPYITWANL